MSHPAEIGANVRRRRQELGLTLEQLAEGSGVSPTMLSEVERSLKNPTVKLAYQIARALGCSLTDLFEDEGAPPPVVIRAADRRSLVDPETGVERHALSPDLLRRGLELVWYVLPAGTSAGEMAPNRSEAQRLGKGDGISYGPQTTVEYRNAGRSTCEFLMLSDSTRAS
jgi:transcriptional regulator with XRE-family HTH domain